MAAPPPVPQNLRILPWPTREIILKHMSISNIISLSIASPEHNEIVKFHREALKSKVGWINVRPFGNTMFEFCFRKKSIRNRDDDDSERKYENVFYSLDYNPSPLDTVQGGIQQMMNHIGSIYQPVSQVFVELSMMPRFSEMKIWNALEKCDDVWIHETVLNRIDLMHLTNYSFQTQLDLFFRKFTVGKGLKIDVNKITNYNLSRHFSKLRNLDFLVIENASWVTEEHFQEFDCQCLSIRRPLVANYEINRWLKRWLASDSKRAKMMVVHEPNGTTFKDWMFEGIEYFRKDISPKTRRFGTFLMKCDLEDADVVTRADGAEAYISVDYPHQLCKVEIYFSYEGCH